MSFASYPFLLVALPAALIVYYALARRGRRAQNAWLLIASLAMYGYANLIYLPILIGSIAINYAFARAIPSRPAASRRLYAWGAAWNLALLGFFKYYGFFADRLAPALAGDVTLTKLVLPLGISFYTIRQILLLRDVRAGDARVGGFLEYALFVSCFPAVASGPIARYGDLAPQFADAERGKPDFDRIARGIYGFGIGLFKKAVIADTLAPFADAAFGAGVLPLPAGWLAMIAYAMQIYFDFSGYADMALGIGGMLGLDLPRNFDAPYRSASISEFWRRWHITLGAALRDLVYIPLGGNRKGRLREAANLWITFLLSGIWHGATLPFAVWGALHGAFAAVERALREPIERIPRALRVAGTFLLVSALWIPFRAETLSDALDLFRSLVNFKDLSFRAVGTLAMDGIADFSYVANALYASALVCALAIHARYGADSSERVRRFCPNRRSMAAATLYFIIAIVHLSREGAFIYFGF